MAPMAYDRTLLTSEAVDAFLKATPGWARAGQELMKTFSFPSFPAAIVFVQRVADAAERANHHPDIDIRYSKVTLKLSTHDAGGLTFRDTALAKEAETLAAA
jgi:4a-hydroxytetrahydrobiopterin dehydratase